MKKDGKRSGNLHCRASVTIPSQEIKKNIKIKKKDMKICFLILFFLFLFTLFPSHYQPWIIIKILFLFLLFMVVGSGQKERKK